MQPGSTITPGGQQNPAEPPAAPKAQPPTPTEQQPLAAAPEAVPVPAQAPTPPPASNWDFKPTEQAVADATDQYQLPAIDPISWTASEYVDHEKNHSWFFAIAGATLGIAIIAFVITRDIISSVVTLVAGALLAVSAARKPHTLSFQLNEHGLQVGSKFYEYASFKSFTVLEEGVLSSIQLLPARRFLPSLNIYYPPDQEEAIISCLGNFLPHEERKRDAVDSLMRRIKF